MSRRPADAVELRDPWVRFGWVMGSVWLVFLVFPIMSVLQADAGAGMRVVGVGLILAFAAVYVRGFRGLDQAPAPTTRSAIGYLAAMIALGGAVSALIGLDALGMLGFTVAFAMFALPPAGAVAWATLCIGVCLVLPLAVGNLPGYAFFAGILLLIAVTTGMARFVEERQHTYDELREEVTLATERDRVARDVHDVLGHSLTVVALKAELAERLVDTDPAQARRELAAIRSLSREALGEIRATVAGLRVARLAEELTAAREALADAGIRANVASEPEVVDPRHRIVLAWVLREAVTNVVRHSRATACAVELGPDSLRVTDDGVGMTPRQEGNGMRGVRERVAAAGGAISITAGPDGRGTVLEVELR